MKTDMAVRVWLVVLGSLAAASVLVHVVLQPHVRDAEAVIEELKARMTALEALAVRLERVDPSTVVLPVDAEVVYAARVVKERPVPGAAVRASPAQVLQQQWELRRRWADALDTSVSLRDFVTKRLVGDWDAVTPMQRLRAVREWMFALALVSTSSAIV